MTFTREQKIGTMISLTALGIVFLLLITILAISTELQYLDFDSAIFWIVLPVIIVTAFFGSRAGTDILTKNKNELLSGIKVGLLALLTFGLTGVTSNMEIADSFRSLATLKNVFSALLQMIVLLICPAVIFGAFIGWRIKKCAR